MTSLRPKYRYDVFISYAHENKDWVHERLVSVLHAAGLSVCIDVEEFRNEMQSKEITQRLLASRNVILVFTPAYFKGKWTKFEADFASSNSILSGRHCVFPIKLEQFKVPQPWTSVQYTSFTDKTREAEQFEKLIRNLCRSRRRSNVTIIPQEHSVSISEPRHKRPSSKPILVLTPLFGYSRVFYSELLEAILSSAQDLGYQVLVSPVNPQEKKALEEYYCDLDDLAGIIAVTCQVENSTWLKDAADHDIPVALVHDNISPDKLDGTAVVSFVRPSFEALQKLIDHLVQDHHATNICVVMVDAKRHAIRTEKLNVITEALKKNGVDFQAVAHQRLYNVPNYSHQAGRDVVDRILQDDPGVEAIVCLSDVTAVGILQKLGESGRVDVLVTGFDDLELARQFHLTSIDQALNKTGDQAVIELHHAIREGKPPHLIVDPIKTMLNRRWSCCQRDPLDLGKPGVTQRFAVYYIVRDTRITSAIEEIREAVYKLGLDGTNTLDLFGNAALFPSHITLKGIFQLQQGKKHIDLVHGLKEALSLQGPFSIHASEVIAYPNHTLSIGFDVESRQKLAELQRDVLKAVNVFRRSETEPEFRQFLLSKTENERSYTAEYGEPFVKELFVPHISIVSGLNKEEEYAKVREIINRSNIRNVDLTSADLFVDSVELVYETVLGGSWKTLNRINLPVG